jgi:hypothetical protein
MVDNQKQVSYNMDMLSNKAQHFFKINRQL